MCMSFYVISFNCDNQQENSIKQSPAFKFLSMPEISVQAQDFEF